MRRFRGSAGGLPIPTTESSKGTTGITGSKGSFDSLSNTIATCTTVATKATANGAGEDLKLRGGKGASVAEKGSAVEKGPGVLSNPGVVAKVGAVRLCAKSAEVAEGAVQGQRRGRRAAKREAFAAANIG